MVAQAYLEWDYPNFDIARNAIIDEFRRARALMLKRLTTTADMSNYAKLSSVETRAIRNQSGPLDKRFSGTQFEQSGEAYATFLDLAMRGEGNRQRVTALLAMAVDKIAPAYSNLLPPEMSEWLIGTMAGLLGLPDEIPNSAQFAIEQASQREWRIARVAARRLRKSLRNSNAALQMPGLDKSTLALLAVLAQIEPQIPTGKWAILIFSQILHGTRSGFELPMKLRVN